MKYLLTLYIVVTFLLGLWQTFRFHYKSMVAEHLLLPEEDFVSFEASEFKTVFLKDLIIRDIFRLYVGGKTYKLITVTFLEGQNVLLDLGLCKNCDFDAVKERVSRVKKIDIRASIIPINKYNFLRKILFRNDHKNNLYFYCDIYEMAKLSNIKESASDALVDQYVIYNTDFVDSDIKVNNIEVFNPHLWYLTFWYSLSVFGIVSFYVKVKKLKL